VIGVNYGPASKYYDLFGSKDDIDFYKELALEHGKNALELGVGTVRVAIELAKAGVTVLGIDNSRYMLNVAKAKLKKESELVRSRVRLKLGDIRSFQLGESFPFVYLPSSTFEHCVTTEDQRKCFLSIYNVLEKNGVLAFDISQDGNEKKPESSWWIDRKEINPHEEVVRTIFSKRNPKTRVVSVNLFFDVYRNGRLTERYYEYGEAKLFSKEEIEKMSMKAGFKIHKVYGDFAKSIYHNKSQKAIFIAIKP